MDIKCSLAMTAAEYLGTEVMPKNMAWMACHYSGSGLGLSNLPQTLPPDSVVIMDDSAPPQEQDPELILHQLKALTQQLQVSALLLDFQRPDITENAQLAALLVSRLPCPVCVSGHYAMDLDCPVFLPPPLLHQPLADHLAPWKGREIWLEAALEAEEITVTAEGSTVTPLPFLPLAENSFVSEELHCRYRIRVEDDRAVFTLARDGEMIKSLLASSKRQGVTQAVGLYQQLGSNFP
jgi:hypothetical protein